MNPTSQLIKSAQKKSLSTLSVLLQSLYAKPKLRSLVLSITKKLEGGEFYSQTLRQIFLKYHKLVIGRYSYGCFLPGQFPEGTIVGSYTSIAESVICLRRNHPYSRPSLHPFFYNRHLGIVNMDTIIQNGENPLVIGSDVWIGRNTIILPTCKRIGNGAVIGAGSIVTKDIPSFSIYAGNPAKLIKNRFPEDVTQLLCESAWWEHPLAYLIDSEFPYAKDADVDSIKRWMECTITAKT